MADITSIHSGDDSINVGNIPKELKDKKKWVLWRWVNRAGKRTKPPLQINGKKAEVNNPETWASFDEVVKELQNKEGKYSGIGFVLTEDDNIVAWDLDHCLNPKTGELEPWAEHIVKTHNSYTEITPSGEGLRIIVTGDLPENGRKKGNVECYKTLRYVTLTGDLYPFTPTKLSSHNPDIYEQYFNSNGGKEKSEKAKKEKKVTTLGLLEQGLWKEAGYTSQSEADLAYCRKLAEDTLGNAEEIDKRFRDSKLFRKKWDDPHYGDGKTYGAGTIELALRSYQSQFRFTDLGNAKRFETLCKDEVRYCHGHWFVWDKKRLKEDDLRQIDNFGLRVIEALRDEAKNTIDREQRDALLKHANGLEQRSKFESMLKFAESRPEIAIRTGDLDKDKFVFNCNNGILDIRGMIRPHAFEELITKLSPVNINMKAEAPLWQKFLDRIMPEKAMQEYLQRAVGYTMTGSVDEQVFFFAYGEGANGKSTFFRMMKKVFGDYFTSLPIESLMATKNEQHSTAIVDLRGVRFASAVEPSEGRAFNEGLLKALTGGEEIVARRMHENNQRFEPTAKLWIMGNHKPIIKGTDHAIWRRVRLVPFTVTIPKAEQDGDLWEKLESEAEGILKWAAVGMMNWFKQGLEPTPETVSNATAHYREEMDSLTEFLQTEVVKEEGAWLLHSSLYNRYSKIAEDNNERALSSKFFATKMREKGFHAERRTGNQMYWKGIMLRVHSEESWQKEM
jgi:putative DNA primase/helicase